MVPLLTGRGRWIGLYIVAAFVAVGALGFLDAHPALAQDVGHRDFAYGANSISAPTGEKPQSKLWFNDGYWWGSLFNNSPGPGGDPNGEYHIYRFDWGSQTWIDTGTPLDTRNSSKADVLWDGNHLYVATATYRQQPDLGKERLRPALQLRRGDQELHLRSGL